MFFSVHLLYKYISGLVSTVDIAVVVEFEILQHHATIKSLIDMKQMSYFRQAIITAIFLLVTSAVNAQFTKQDSLKCKTLSKDWRGNLYMEFKKPDTSIVQIKVFDSNGYVKRIKAYRLVSARKMTVAEGDALYINPFWSDEGVRYLYMNKQPIKETDIDGSLF